MDKINLGSTIPAYPMPVSLVGTYVDGKPRISMARGDGKLSPRIREESLESAIPTIPLDAIQQFLTKPLVVDEGELEKAPYIVQNADEHVVAGGGDRTYVRGIDDETGLWDVFRPGGPLVNPDTKEVLGYQTRFVGEAAVERFGDPATLLLTQTDNGAALDTLADYGRHLGMAFQMIDDALDYSSSNEEMGKNVGDDLAEGKPTLPVIRALQTAAPEHRAVLREAIEYCEQARDYVSRELFEDILASEEEHIDWLETQLELIEKVGLQNYQQSKM